jgi:alkylation response protein AidB-like acyl-CoA dehydrogenase
MPNIEFSADKRDIFFTLFEQVGVQQLLSFEAFSHLDEETLQMTLDEAIRFAVHILGPANREWDTVGAQYKDGSVTLPPSFHKAYKEYINAGWNGLLANPEYGGQGFPEVIGSAVKEVQTGANTSFALLPLLTNGTSHLIEAFGTEEMKKTYCEKMYTGQWAGTMCLTEPHAGSDVGALTTMATPQDDHYLIQGTKIFITCGDHDATDNIIHAVLARTPGAPAGTKGISLFLVPKFFVNPDGSLGEKNDIQCGRIEEKMGIHGSPTCVMNFGEEGRCKGWLLGELHRGMACMFQMMNEARLGVGVQGLAGGAAAYLSALGYAQQRRQGADPRNFKDPNAPRAEIIRHPDIRRMLLTMKAYVEGIRSMIYHTGLYIDLSNHHPDPTKREEYNLLVELLTPICKAYGSDMGFKVCDMAVQTYGGYGYTQDYPVEQYLRDIKIAAIYEGTNGIQALDLLSRKLGTLDGQRLKIFLKHIQQAFQDIPADHPLTNLVQEIRSAQTLLQDTTLFLLKKAQSGDLAHGLLHATPFLDMFGNFTAAFYLTHAALIAHDKLQAIYQKAQALDASAQAALRAHHNDAAFYHAKICTAQFFNAHILTNNLSIAASTQHPDQSALSIRFLDESL